MPGTRKTDEDDFDFVVAEYPPLDGPKFQVVNDRILDVPKKTRSIPVGGGHTKSVTICLHGTLVTQPCALCQYEAPRVGGAR